MTLTLATLLALAGCGDPSASMPATSATALPTRNVRLGDRPWLVLVAPDDGMRGRGGFDDADGMLFDFGREVDPGRIAFVMGGVAFPLDIAWFDAAGRQVGAGTMSVCAAEPCPQYRPDRPFRWAIEAPAGALAGVLPTDLLAVED